MTWDFDELFPRVVLLRELRTLGQRVYPKGLEMRLMPKYGVSWVTLMECHGEMVTCCREGEAWRFVTPEDEAIDSQRVIVEESCRRRKDGYIMDYFCYGCRESTQRRWNQYRDTLKSKPNQL